MTTRFTRSRNASARSSLLADIRIAEAMHHGVITCDPDLPLNVVARIMAAHRIHCVVVPAEDEDPAWGVVSDLDLVDAAYGGALAERLAGETAATSMLTVAPTDTLERAAQLMHEYRKSHVIVADPGSNAPIGVLSTLDVADAIAELVSWEV
jgi:CBS domain-containing protein